MKDFKYTCTYCWKQLTFVTYTLDRIDNTKCHSDDNCVVACALCNKSRADTLYHKFYRESALKRYSKEHPMIHLITEKNKEVFYKLKSNICGGLSLVFHRYHEKDVTKIQRTEYKDGEWKIGEEGKKVSKIVGYDATALYLWCIGQEMPCGELRYIKTEDTQKYLNKDFFGFLEVDIEVPQHLYNYYSELPPIVKNVEYNEEVCGDYTKNLLASLDKKYTKSRKLVATLKGEKQIIKSTRLQWLLSHGCVVTKLHGVIPAIPNRCFKGFVDWVSDERRKGDVDSIYAIIAEAAKTIGNSAFGRTIMDKNKHQSVVYCNEAKFNKLKNKWNFYDANPIGNIYEVMMKKATVKQNLPVQIGCSIFDDSKLRMFQFYYECVDKYISREDYQYIETDTDSAYMAITGDFESLIKPELREEFEKDKHNWFPRTDTLQNKAYDKRKPGLFKIEYEGDGMVALCPKSYIVWKQGETKISSKGCQKRNNASILNQNQYKQCLISGVRINCINRGFRVSNKIMKTYEQVKIGLTPIYTKGVVLENGINIAPLNI